MTLHGQILGGRGPVALGGADFVVTARRAEAFRGWTEGLGGLQSPEGSNEKFPPKLKCLFCYKEMNIVMQNLEKFFVFLTLKAVILCLWGP